MIKNLISLNIVLILSIGNFIPLPNDSLFTIIVKSFIFLFSSVLLFFFFKEIKFKVNVLIYILVITVFFLISSIISNDFIYATEKYFSNSFSVVFPILLINIFSNNYQLTELLKSIVFIGLVILSATIIYKLKFGFWDRQVRFFINGPIIFGWLMGFYFILSIHLFRVLKSKIYIVFSIVFLTALIWTESKGPLLALVIATVFYLIFGASTKIKLLFIMFFSVLFLLKNHVIGFLEVLLSNTRLSGIIRLISGSIDSQDAGSISIRQNMLVEGFQMIKDNPLSGIGIGNYQFYTKYGFFYPHNSHLEIIIESGLLIGFFYVLFISMSFVNSPKLIKILMIYFIICSSFSGDINYLRFIFILCLLPYGATRISINRTLEVDK